MYLSGIKRLNSLSIHLISGNTFFHLFACCEVNAVVLHGGAPFPRFLSGLSKYPIILLCAKLPNELLTCFPVPLAIYPAILNLVLLIKFIGSFA